MSNNTVYKTSRKYKCPYCDIKDIRGNLVDHVEKIHKELIPEDYTASRVVYDFINGKNYGTCMICKKKVYNWNDKINKYYNLCGSTKCKEKVREIALARHIKIHNKPTLLNDPEHQEKMLANRSISGTYTFSDGGKVTYTGKYERNALEFMDKVLSIPSKDIQAPGPVLEYDYEGKTHKWITDIYYIPANLLIEVKDGGSNPNNRSMESYRAKQVAKETMVTDIGTFNYIRLTNNNFVQLLDIFSDMKLEAINNENPKSQIHINEEVGGLPPHRPPEAYMVPYGMNNTFLGFAYSDSEMDKFVMDDESHTPISESVLYSKYEIGPKLYYCNDDIRDKMNLIHNDLKNNKYSNFVECLIGHKPMKLDDVFISESFKYFDANKEAIICNLIESAVVVEADMGFDDSNVIDTKGNVKIHISPKGYYATTYSKFYMASEYFSDLESLLSSNIIDIMNNIYNKNSNGGK